MKQFTFCPYRRRVMLVLKCDYAQVVCKCERCPYFHTLKQAKQDYDHRVKAAVDICSSKIAEMKRKARSGSTSSKSHCPNHS